MPPHEVYIGGADSYVRQTMKEDGRNPQKKPYESPQLRVYANLRELTEARNSMVGQSDGAYGSFLKTG